MSPNANPTPGPPDPSGEPTRYMSPESDDRPLTKVGPSAVATPTRAYLLWVAIGVVLAAVAVMGVSALAGRPTEAPPVDARGDLVCTGHTDDQANRTVKCLPESSTTTITVPDDIPVEGDPLVDGPIVTSAPSGPPEIGPGELDEDVAACMAEIFQERFTPEEMYQYATEKDGPRIDEWHQTGREVAERCREH